MDPLRLYVDPAWRRDAPHTPLLYPFWGNTFSAKLPFTRHVLETYPFDTNEYHILDAPEGADVVLVPYRYDVARRYSEILRGAEAASKKYQLKIVYDAMGDVDCAIAAPEAIVLKYGGYRFEKRQNEIILPPYADDLLERYCDGELAARHKSEIPTVGFAGWTEASLARRAYWRLKEFPLQLRGVFDSRADARSKGIFFRRAALRALKASDAVTANVLARTAYSGHRATAVGDIEILRREFVENALASDLCLDVRGDANNSTRLFEILSLGRVPLIIDTERNFPFSEELDYRSFSIIVDFRDIKKVPEIARQTYDAIAPNEWLKMQERARAVYREWFRPDAMTKHLIRAIRAQLEGAKRRGDSRRS